MATYASEGRHRPISIQRGSIQRKWDKAELLRCGAIGTTERRTLDLCGEIHPVFANWTHVDDSALHEELQQPLLLASKILEAVGLPWLSDFFIDDDLSDETYTANHHHGRAHEQIPQSIPRHHRASWASQDLKRKWLDDTRNALKSAELSRSLDWQLDTDMFREKGWVGYTCRHPRGAEMGLEEIDVFETIVGFDRRATSEDSSHGGRKKKYRSLSVLVMAEFPARLQELRRVGREGGEEYLLTAFMATVTILHELGHVAYWKDRRRPLMEDLREPFYGADLEMELGDSFVASLFGGWIPAPIEDISRRGPTLDAGIAWRQSLSWDYHRIRPKYRAHYSIPVDYIARLFREEAWSSSNDLKNIIQPQILSGENGMALKTVGLLFDISPKDEHATAALPDFHPCGEGWRWNRRTGAGFRISQWHQRHVDPLVDDGYLCPEIDLPVATDDVIKEREPDPLPSPSGLRTVASEDGGVSQKDRNGWPKVGGTKPPLHKTRVTKIKKPRDRGNVVLMNPSLKKDRAGHTGVATDMLSLDRCEISVDELKKRLSQLIGVSLGELEKLLETSQCGEVGC